MKHSIVPITLDNVHEIRRYAKEFMATLNQPCDVDYYIGRWRVFIQTGVGIGWLAIVDDQCVGGIGGIVAPDILSGIPTMVELFWYVTPKYRRYGILLYREMERYVDMNNLRWAMIHMEGSMPDELTDFYQHEQFNKLETHWVRERRVLCP